MQNALIFTAFEMFVTHYPILLAARRSVIVTNYAMTWATVAWHHENQWDSSPGMQLTKSDLKRPRSMVLGEGLDCLMLAAKQNVKGYCQYGGMGAEPTTFQHKNMALQLLPNYG